MNLAQQVLLEHLGNITYLQVAEICEGLGREEDTDYAWDTIVDQGFTFLPLTKKEVDKCAQAVQLPVEEIDQLLTEVLDVYSI